MIIKSREALFRPIIGSPIVGIEEQTNENTGKSVLLTGILCLLWRRNFRGKPLELQHLYSSPIPSFSPPALGATALMQFSRPFLLPTSPWTYSTYAVYPSLPSPHQPLELQHLCSSPVPSFSPPLGRDAVPTTFVFAHPFSLPLLWRHSVPPPATSLACWAWSG